tara:strand:+ start:2358 stop:4208 length:1851 start_codon:yes stop_codon:yes gene_type:complete
METNYYGNLFIDNIGYKIKIIRIYDTNKKDLSIEGSKFKNYSDYYKNVNFIEYFEYTLNDLNNIIKKNNKLYNIFKNIEDKEFYLYLYILNYHNAHCLIMDDFYINNNYNDLIIDNIKISKDEKIFITSDNLNENMLINFKNKNIFINDYNVTIINNNIIGPFLNNTKLNYNKNLFYIKSERHSGSNFFENLLNYYFNSNNTDNLFFIDNHLPWKHQLLSQNDIEYLNNSNIITIFLKKDIFPWIESMFIEQKNIYPQQEHISNFVLNKIADKLNFYIDIKNKNKNNIYNDIFDLYYTKNNNFLDAKLNKKIYINYEDLIYDHFEIIKLISKKYNLKILKKENKNFNKYNKKDYYLDKIYMNNFNEEIKNYILNNKNINIENKWNKAVEKLEYTKNNLLKYTHYTNFKYALFYYFDSTKDDIFKLKLSIYLLKKNLFSDLDIFVFYTNKINLKDIDFDSKIRFISFNKEPIMLFNPYIINTKFVDYQYIYYANYDFFLNEKIDLNSIEIYDYEYFLINLDRFDINKEKYLNINNKLNYKFYTNNILKYDILNINDINFFGLKINYLNNNNIIKLFDLIIKYNYFISIQDFTFYLAYEIPQIKKLIKTFDYYNSQLI